MIDIMSIKKERIPSVERFSYYLHEYTIIDSECRVLLDGHLLITFIGYDSVCISHHFFRLLNDNYDEPADTMSRFIYLKYAELFGRDFSDNIELDWDDDNEKSYQYLVEFYDRYKRDLLNEEISE